jgi:hypothetical protein
MPKFLKQRMLQDNFAKQMLRETSENIPFLCIWLGVAFATPFYLSGRLVHHMLHDNIVKQKHRLVNAKVLKAANAAR